MSGWDLHYGDLIEWRAASAGGKIARVDPMNMQVETNLEWRRVMSLISSLLSRLVILPGFQD
ncbi:MAG: hypothetical protein Ct9H300mP28_02830 [Pseudomonadota bacterium]|nr:MAG: hypothetical protein Ct9H300mP28_02830 [Pseudomonadota bacterium]